MNLQTFFVDALASALEHGVATTDDIVRHATPDVLSIHLPRPLWSRLFAACLAAPRVDSRLVVETIGLPSLCEHVPAPILWACIHEFGNRAFGADWKPAVAAPIVAAPAKSAPLATPPPPDEIAKPVAAAPARSHLATIPTPDMVEVEEPAAPTATGTGSTAAAAPRTRPPVQQRFRQSSTGIGRLAPSSSTPTSSARKPQATTTTVAAPPAPPPRRSNTDSEDDVMTEVGGKDDWKNALAVEDEQLVDWTASDEGTNVDELGRRK